MVGWFEGLQQAFKLERCTVAAATDYLDRYLSQKSCTPLNFHADVEAHQSPRPCTARNPRYTPPARADARSLFGRSPYTKSLSLSRRPGREA